MTGCSSAPAGGRWFSTAVAVPLIVTVCPLRRSLLCSIVAQPAFCAVVVLAEPARLPLLLLALPPPPGPPNPKMLDPEEVDVDLLEVLLPETTPVTTWSPGWSPDTICVLTPS